MSVITIIIALALLTFMAFKGIPIVYASMISALVFLIITAPTAVYTGISTHFMEGFANFVRANFLIFLGGALFGVIVEMGGAAESIAHFVVSRFGDKYICIGIFIATAILTMGGVSVFVCFFAIYPFAVSLFRQADIPRKMFVISYLAGGGTFTMTGPFSPAIQNIIPTTYLGTTASAGALVGVICMVVCAAMGMIYVHTLQARCKRKGEHFIPLPSDIVLDENAKRPSMLVALLPMIILLLILNALKLPVEVALFSGIIAAMILYFPYYTHDAKEFLEKIGSAVTGAASSIANTSASVGFGKVLASSAAFASVIPVATSIGGNPLISAGIATTVLAGLSGSASGGLGIALPIVSEIFMPLGVNPEALHRVASIASSGLDSMPHNGAVVTFLNASRTTHKEAYLGIFMTTVVFTLCQMVLAMVLFIAFGQTYA